MKKIIFQTMWAGFWAFIGGAALIAGQGTGNKVFGAIILFLALNYYWNALVWFMKWKRATPEERTKLDEEYRKSKPQRRKNRLGLVVLGIFFFIIYAIGDMTKWNFLYVVLVGGYVVFWVIPKVVEGIMDARRKKRDEAAEKAQAEIDGQKAEAEKKKRDAWKDEPDLWLGERTPAASEKAFGLLMGIDRETGRRTIELKKIKDPAGERHVYVIGGSGTGKTKFLESLIVQDIKNGAGFGVIDPHGDLTEEVKGYLMFWARPAKVPHVNYGLVKTGEITRAEVEEHQKNLMFNVVLIDPADEKAAVRFNPLEPVPGVPSAAIADEMVASFRKIWDDSWGPRMEDVLRNTFIALSESGGSLGDMPEFFADADFRRKKLTRVKNKNCLARFRQFEQESERMWLTRVEPVLNKINAILADPRIAAVFNASKSTFNLREIMDGGKILLVKLDRGQLKGAADLFGSLLFSKIQMTAFSRSDQASERRKPFTLYIDEFQNFATENFVQTLSEARKYKLSLVLAHQNLSQLPERLQASVFSNCGVHVYFKLSYKDAQILSREGLNFPHWEPSGLDKLFASEWGGEYGTRERKPEFESEQWRLYWFDMKERVEMLQSLEPQICVVRNKAEDEAQKLRVPDLRSFWKTLDQKDFAWIKSEVEPAIGAAFMRSWDDEQQGAEAEKLTEDGDEDEEIFRERKAP